MKDRITAVLVKANRLPLIKGCENTIDNILTKGDTQYTAVSVSHRLLELNDGNQAGILIGLIAEIALEGWECQIGLRFWVRLDCDIG